MQTRAGASSGLLPVSKRASRPRFAPSVPPRFANPAHKRADAENHDFPPLARTSINSPSEGLFVARERELEKGSSLTLLPHLLGYSSNCVSLSADLGVLTGARCSSCLNSHPRKTPPFFNATCALIFLRHQNKTSDFHNKHQALVS